jgi:hypothetical protein
MYTVNSEISGEGNIEKNYTYNVMVSGLGIIIGPALSGKYSEIRNTNEI